MRFKIHSNAHLKSPDQVKGSNWPTSSHFNVWADTLWICYPCALWHFQITDGEGKKMIISIKKQWKQSSFFLMLLAWKQNSMLDIISQERSSVNWELFFCPLNQDFNLGTTYIWDWINLCYRKLAYAFSGCLSASLASAQQMPMATVSHPSSTVTNKNVSKHCQMSLCGQDCTS